MPKWTSAPANAFGSGVELSGKFYRGKEISSFSTRKHIVLLDGTRIPRKGARVDYQIPTGQEWRDRERALNKRGFRVIKLWGGVEPAWGFTQNGSKSVYAFDNSIAVIIHIENNFPAQEGEQDETL